MILSSSRFDQVSQNCHNHHIDNNPHNNINRALSGNDGKKKTAPASIFKTERPQSKRRSPGFFKNFIHESKDALLAPFHPNRRKGIASSDNSKSAKDKGTQTRSADCVLPCPSDTLCGVGGSSTAFSGVGNNPRFCSSTCPQHGTLQTEVIHGFQSCQHHQLLHRLRRSSRARSDPSTPCSLTNLSSVKPAMLSMSTFALSNIHQKISSKTVHSQNDLTSDAISKGFSNASQWNGSTSGVRPGPITSGSPSITTYWQQMREDIDCPCVSSPQSRTLPTRLEPSSLLSPDWSLPAKAAPFTLPAPIQYNNFTGHHNNMAFSLKRSASSTSSGGASPLLSACCCYPNELSHRLTSTSSCPSDRQQPDEQRLFLVGNVVISIYRSLIEPFVEELLRYPWGRDSLWLMAFVVFTSTLVLLGYVITTVLPTMFLAISLAICKSLVFRRSETIAHLRVLAASMRCSMFTRECIQSLRSAILQLVKQTLELLIPPVIVPTSIQMSTDT